MAPKTPRSTRQGDSHKVCFKYPKVLCAPNKKSYAAHWLPIYQDVLFCVLALRSKRAPCCAPARCRMALRAKGAISCAPVLLILVGFLKVFYQFENLPGHLPFSLAETANQYIGPPPSTMALQAKGTPLYPMTPNTK